MSKFAILFVVGATLGLGACSHKAPEPEPMPAPVMPEPVSPKKY